MNEELRVVLFQSVRELLINVIKHADARSATVSMRRLNGNAEIKVSDKGRGYDTSLQREVSGTDGGFGLFNIRERLDLLGGTFDIKSAVGKGTVATITIPVRSANSSEMARKAASEILPS